MPNYCSNRITILAANPQSTDAIKKLMIDDNGMLDYNIMKPQPDSESQASLPEDMTPEQAALNDVFASTALPWWYVWRVNNWGCKWNGGEITLNDHEDKAVTIDFSSPWGPPDKWFIALAVKLKGDNIAFDFIELEYIEPGCLVAGSIGFNGTSGEVTINIARTIDEFKTYYDKWYDEPFGDAAE